MERDWEGEEDRVREIDRRENRNKPNNMRQIKRDRETNSKSKNETNKANCAPNSQATNPRGRRTNEWQEDPTNREEP